MKIQENKWVEIISVRLFSSGNVDMLLEIFSEMVAGKCEVTGNPVNAELYVDHCAGTDWSVYIHHNISNGPPRKTRLGLTVAGEFCSLGLVNHSVWKKNPAKKETDHA